MWKDYKHTDGQTDNTSSADKVIKLWIIFDRIILLSISLGCSKTVHKWFLCPYKRQSSIAFRIFTNTCEVTLQVKRAIERAILCNLLIHTEYMCLCLVSTLFCMICCLFSNWICSKSSTTQFRSIYIMFYLCCKCATFLCARTPIAMQWSVALRSAFYRNREDIYEFSSALNASHM